MNLAPYENYVLTNDIIEGDARARGRDMYAGGAQGARTYLLSKRKNESGEHAGNRSGECMGNRLSESAGDARESKRNDWTDNHAEARAGKWLKRE